MSRVSVLWIMVPLLVFAGEISAQGTENALQFDGVDDYVAVVAPIGMPISAITIEAWIKLTAYSPWASIVDRYNSVNDGLDPFSFGLDSSTGSRLMFQWNNPGGSGWPNKIVSSSILPLGQWVHVAVSSDEVTATFYINGVPDGTGSVGALGVGDRIIIGANFPGGDEFFNGTIDEVRIWNIARTVGEIREDMHMTVVGERFGLLVGCWRFDEGTGTTAADIVSNIPPNNGVLQNGPVWVESTVPLGNIDNPLDSRIAVPVSTPGLIAFGDLDMSFTTKSGTDTVVVTLLNTSPKGTQPGIVSSLFPKYWVIRKYGGGTFDTDLTFTLSPGALGQAAQSNPETVKLFRRESNADGAWALVASGASATANTVTFNGITSFSQFVVGVDTIPPSAPQNLLAVAGSGQVTLRWKKSTEADVFRYRIYRDVKPAPTAKVDSTASGMDTTKTFTGLTNGMIYYFRVTTVDSSGNESGFSNEVAVVPTDTITVSIGTVSGVVGAEVLVPVRIGNVVPPDTTGDDIVGKGIIKTTFEISFNTTTLDFVELNLGLDGVVAAAGDTVSLKVAPGILTIKNSGSDSLPHKGLMFLLRLKVIGGIQGEHLPLSFQRAEVTAKISSDPADPGFLLPVTLLAGGVDIVTSADSLRGDINHTGTTTAFDAILLLRFLVGLEAGNALTTPPDARDFSLVMADVNRDGRLSPLDAALVFQLDAGIITTFPTATAKLALSGERRVVLGEPRYAGETVTVPVMVDDRAGVLAGEMMLTYDPALVEIREVKPAEEVMGWHVAGYAQEGRLRVVFAGAEAGTGAGELFLMKVRSLRGMEDDGSPLTIAEVILNDGMFTTRVQPRLPTAYALLQNIPNPFNPETQIRYELPKAGHVTVIVYSLTGQVVRTLVDRQQLAGRYMVTWDGRDEEGRVVASGISIYRLTAGAFTAVRKMVMIR